MVADVENGLPEFVTGFGLSRSHMEHVTTLPKSRRAQIVYALRNLVGTLTTDEYDDFIKVLNSGSHEELERQLEPHKLPYYELPSEYYETIAEPYPIPSVYGVSQTYIPAEVRPKPFFPSPAMYPERPDIIDSQIIEEPVRVRRPRIERAKEFGRARIQRKPSTRKDIVYRIVESISPPPSEPSTQVIQIIHDREPRSYRYDFGIEEGMAELEPVVTDAKVDPRWRFIKEGENAGGIVEFYISPEGFRIVDWGTNGMYGPYRTKTRAEEVFRSLISFY